jgi:hypothetical protein
VYIFNLKILEWVNLKILLSTNIEVYDLKMDGFKMFSTELLGEIFKFSN